MQRRISRLPFLGFLLLFVVPVFAVFLLARDGQNLKQLSRWLGVPIEETERPPVEIRPVQRSPASQHLSNAPSPPRSHISLVERLMANPAPPGERHAGFLQADPERRCHAISTTGEAKPEFLTAAGDWTCLAERRYPNSDDILFLQVSGRGHTLRIFRAKLNLYDGNALKPMAESMAKALHVFAPINSRYVEGLVRRTVEQDRDQPFILGYGRIEIERESGEGRRYNIFVRSDTPPKAPPTPPSGFRLPQTLGRASE